MAAGNNNLVNGQFHSRFRPATLYRTTGQRKVIQQSCLVDPAYRKLGSAFEVSPLTRRLPQAIGKNNIRSLQFTERPDRTPDYRKLPHYPTPVSFANFGQK
jgi:hypothetical protein